MTKRDFTRDMEGAICDNCEAFELCTRVDNVKHERTCEEGENCACNCHDFMVRVNLCQMCVGNMARAHGWDLT